MEKNLFTSESVSEGHPDKLCDQISDAILDECLRQDKYSRVACECFATTNLLVIGGEITTNAKVDYEAVARDVMRRIGYTAEDLGIDADTCEIKVVMDTQSSDIALGTNVEVGGAGDQGIMFGYATNETETYMPLPISMAHELVRYASELRHNGTFKHARPDMKSQVTIDYTDENNPKVDTILMSIQHDPDFNEEEFKTFIKEKIMKEVVRKHHMNEEKQGFDLIVLIKILYKNILLIAITTILVTSLALIATTRNKSFKTEINLYSNDRVLREINEIPKFSLSSFDYLNYLHKNSKSFAAKEPNAVKFTQLYSQKVTVESEDNNPNVKIKFTTSSIAEGNKMAQEYANSANSYINEREKFFLDSQLKLLQEQYNFINSNSDIRTTKDTLTDTLVARLGYYRLLKNDTSPLLKLVNYTTKPAMNKKLVVAFALLMGLFLGILIAIIKEFSKTLDLKSLKNRG